MFEDGPRVHQPGRQLCHTWNAAKEANSNSLYIRPLDLP